MSKQRAAVNGKLKVMRFFWIATTPPMQMTKCCQSEPQPEELSKYKFNKSQASICFVFCHYGQIWVL